MVQVLRKVRRSLSWPALCAVLIALPAGRTVAQTCAGDCNGNGRVSVDSSSAA
jgi:hypothetical protein